MTTPMYAIRIKSVNRYHYRGVLYRRIDPVNRHPDGRFIVLEHVVNRELRDHLVGSGFFEDVRPEEPQPVEPVAVPEPVAISQEPETLTGEIKAGNDMSNASVTGYGKPKGSLAEV